jgi:hypothetical protein
MLQNIDTSDVKAYSLYIAYAAIWAKLVFEALNAEASMQHYEFAAWAATTLATLALSAWVTLNVVQVALKNASFKTYGEPIYKNIGTLICGTNLVICIMLFGQDLQEIKSIFASGICDDLDPHIPENMDQIIGELEKMFEDTNPNKTGHRELTQSEETGIKTICTNVDRLWEKIEYNLEIVRPYARKRKTVEDIDSYKLGIENMIENIRGLRDGSIDAQGTIGNIIDITKFNRDFYRTMLEEVEAK